MPAPFVIEYVFLKCYTKKSYIEGISMRKRKDKLYDFDVNYEYKIYKKVGLDYKKTKSRNIIENADKKLKSYKVCYTYSEWKKHIEDTIRKDFTNREDFLHWLYGRKSFSEAELDLVRVVQIPVYIVFISIITQIYDIKSITMEHIIFIIAFMVVISAITLLDAYKKLHFYEDVIEIYEKMFKENNGN